MSKVSYYTKEGLDKLKNELKSLRTKGRAEVANQLSEAREKGDLSENAEYDAAKDAQGMLELKISKLEQEVASARIISEADIDTSKVGILVTVKVKNLQNNHTVAYTIVSEKESDLKAGKISIKSPIGKGLLGKKVGDTAEINVPSGKIQFKILDIGIG